jgi:hypothetical protein
MNNPKEPGGWGRDNSGQPAGVKDRTFGSREAFPRDVDEGFGRNTRSGRDRASEPAKRDKAAGTSQRKPH